MPITLDIKGMANALESHCPNVAFAYLLGSAQSGTIQEGADIDIAVYLKDTGQKPDTLNNLYAQIEPFVGGTLIDIIFLNGAEPVIAFEAIRGTRLFVRDDYLQEYAGFYSLTCREYEDKIAWMKKQLEYRGYDVQWDH